MRLAQIALRGFIIYIIQTTPSLHRLFSTLNMAETASRWLIRLSSLYTLGQIPVVAFRPGFRLNRNRIFVHDSICMQLIDGGSEFLHGI